jgi:HD-GYP domain-containing protein (c-di-GMP phosphodiesterase class II)
MSDLPLRTRVYTIILTVVTVGVLGSAISHDGHGFARRDLLTAAILVIMVILVEKFEIDFPHAAFQFSVTVGAILAFAAGITLGPLIGALVVITAELVSDIWQGLKPIQVLVNSANLGLATYLGATTYHQLAGDVLTPLDSGQAMAATVAGALVYTMVNTWVLAFVIAPVVGDSPVQLWKSNFSVTYIFLVLPTLGSLVPVINERSPFGIPILALPLIGSHLAQRTLRRVEEETQATMEGLADALERRDPYTHRHSIRVTEYVQAILHEMPHIPSLTQETIIEAARVHDLGKVGTRDASLSKPGPLTEEERREIEQHAAVGGDIVGRLSIYRRGAAIVRHHHERWDGKGYPDGLAGEEIPLGARIIGVADAFDAMTSDRPYRRGMAIKDALDELNRQSGKQFDPQIVEAFQRAIATPATIPEASTSPAVVK